MSNRDRKQRSVKRTAGKAASAPIVLGDAALGAVFVRALEAADEVDRWTHGFHTWPAGLHPDAAAALVGAFPGRRVLDPFCGGGTVLVEARAAGREAYGNDLSPIATRVARARTSTADEALLTRFRSRARKLTEAARGATELPPDPIRGVIGEWYAPHVIAELEALRRGVMESEPDVRPLLEVCFSAILIKTSWRKSDTSAQRVKHDRPAGTAAILFHKKVREIGRRIAAFREAVPEGTPEARVSLGDARDLRADPPVELVLTSPPYPSTYDYLPLQHLRTAWLGDRPDVDAEIGARRLWRLGERDAKRQWRADTGAWMGAAAGCLAPGGHLVVVIGDGLTPTGTIDSSEPSEAAAKAAGLRSVARASVERVDHARETVRWEHVLCWQRPA